MGGSVQVLLSSYNGEEYIREQLDSILAQEGTEVRLLVRDDGSGDGTRDILAGYGCRYTNIEVVYGRNIGAAKSFFELLRLAGDSPYIALSDQDDVWLPDKLSRAVRMVSQKERECPGKPVVYCSAKQLVDGGLAPLKAAVQYKKVRPSFGNALVENMCSGCTCVMNQEMLRLLKRRTPEFTVMHDFWIYLVGACFGEVLYDPKARILYRQHGRNGLGAASGRAENYKRRLKNYRKHRGQLPRQAAEFIRLYGMEMPEGKRRLALDLSRAKTDWKARGRLLKGHAVFRQRKVDDIIFRVLLASGLI